MILPIQRNAALAAIVALALAPAFVLTVTRPAASLPPVRYVAPLDVEVWRQAETPVGRPIFLKGDGPARSRTDAEAPALIGPTLIGIVGRLPHDAFVMVRKSDGTIQSLAVGGVSDGWRIAAITRDAALFQRGAVSLRMDLPIAGPAEPMPSN